MNDAEAREMVRVTRRDFLKWMGIGTGAAAIAAGSLHYFRPADAGDNPLARSVNREWEKIYRDQYKYDRTLRLGLLSQRYPRLPGARLRSQWHRHAHGRHLRLPKLRRPLRQQSNASIGIRASAPRATPSIASSMGLTGCVIRSCAKVGRPGPMPAFPSSRRRTKRRYMFDARGQDEFVQISWPDAFDSIAKALVAISTRYSGEAGKKLLLAQGYQPEMVEEMGGAGTRTIKMRGGMGLLGVIGKYGMYRLNNSLALLDAKIRGVGPDKARAGRNFSNYTWHGDQAPGHPWVHGLQASECDFNDLRFSKLIIMDGKNLVENKLTDSHWFIECMERGAKIVVIAPEYGPPSTKADYWIPIRPTTDAALWLGITRLMIDKKWYDEAFVKRFTDFPLLVRKDNLKRLRAHEIFPQYKTTLSADGPSMKIQGLTAEQHAKLGDFVIWDARRTARCAITRDDVGESMAKKGSDPALEGNFKIKLADGKEVEVATLWTLYQAHLKDYDLDTVVEITQAPKAMIEQLAQDIATMKPVAIHQGEGINHWFHATEMNRAAYLPLMLTGNIGQPGAGCHTWAGNYKAALFQGSPWTGPGFKGWVAEDPFEINLDPKAHGKDIHAHAYTKDEEPAYWNHGDLALIVEHAEVWPQKFYRREPHAHAHQGSDLQQRQPDQQRQVGLRHDQERQPECRDDRVDGHSDDRVDRVCRSRAAGQLMARIRRTGNHGELLESVPANLEGRHRAGLRQQR